MPEGCRPLGNPPLIVSPLLAEYTTLLILLRVQCPQLRNRLRDLAALFFDLVHEGRWRKK